MYPPYRPYRTAFIIAAVYIAATVIAFLAYIKPSGIPAGAVGYVVGRASAPVLLAALMTGFWASRARLEWSAARIGVTLLLIAVVLLSLTVVGGASR